MNADSKASIGFEAFFFGRRRPCRQQMNVDGIPTVECDRCAREDDRTTDG